MENKKKGFGGLDDLVSDISGDLATDKPEQQSNAGHSSPVPGSTQETSQKSTWLSQSGSSSQAQPEPQQPPSQNSSGNGSAGNWAILSLLVGVLFLIIFIASGRKDEQASPDVSSATPSPPQSIYAQAIPELSADQGRLIAALLQAGQANDASAIEKAAAAVEAKATKPVVDKNLFKESRARNKTGLQHLKEGRKDLAASDFLEAYNLNPHDPEVVDNLGYSLGDLGDHAAAKKAYLTALIQSPRRASAWNGLARVYALNSDPDKAASALALAFRFSKAPKTLRQTLLATFRSESNVLVKSAIGHALAKNYSSSVAGFVRPALGNLSAVEIPIILPANYSPKDFEGKPFSAFVLNTELFRIEATADSYHISIGSEPDCHIMACAAGSISARKVLPTDTDEGDPVELQGGIRGVIVKGEHREGDHLVFHIGQVRYSFNVGTDPVADVDAANSAIKLGAIPSEILALLPTMPLSTNTAPESSSQFPVPAQTSARALAPAAPAYAKPRSDRPCYTTYNVVLETFGEGVTVELRNGTPGNSVVVDVVRSSGGNVHFSRLCAGLYFLAIGNGDSVSVTPSRNFEDDMEYTSTIRMQQGYGNVSSKRRNEL